MKMNDKKRIVFACGGTMGHINPALVISKHISKNNDIYFISTTKELNNQTYKEYNHIIRKVFFFDVRGFDRQSIFKNIRLFKINIQSYFQIKKVLKKINPDIIISMGGSIGTIAGLAKNKKSKLILHEQNSILGLGNKILLNKANKLLLSYPITINKKINTVLVGNPVECEYYEKYATLGIERDYILVFGGSLGATKINDFFIDNYKMINTKIVLITGKRYYDENIDRIKDIKEKDITIIPYCIDMPKLYKNAKVVISRGGATSIAEIIALSKISIIIPSPNVTNNHQYFNAMYYKNKGCLEVLLESDLRLSDFMLLLAKVLDKDNIQNMIQNIQKNHIIYSSYLFIDEMMSTI